MLDQPLSALAGSLKPFAKAVGKAAVSQARRLHAERQAGRASFQGPTNFMNFILNETLGRLQGGNIDDTWWSYLLHRLGQQYVAPVFLKTPALQEWLAEEHVADDLKALASAQIMGGVHDEEDTRVRLSQSYSNRTGEAPPSANGPIDVVVAVLAAGYIASVPYDQRPVAGMVQKVSRQVSEISEHLHEIRLPAATDPIIQKAHTKQAAQALSIILIVRAFDPLRARRNIQELRSRVGDEGDLFAASNSAKNKVLYWTSRLCAVDTETLALARQLRNELKQTDPDRDLSIVDALLAESDGAVSKALFLLRDHEDPDSRATLFSMLTRSRGERDALAWYADQAAPDDDQFFTAVGWKNWAVCMAKIGKWREAAQRLLGFESHWQETPALALVEGVVNAAMLLPDDHREGALETVPIYQGVALNLVAQAENHHSRAATCFEFAEQRLVDIAEQDLAEFIAEWRLWIRLMDPNTTNVKVVRFEIRQGMEEGARAVKLMQFAWSFDIPFDVNPLRAYLKQRKRLGGLNNHELLAECLLFDQSMSRRDFVTYLDQQRTRLSKVMPLATVTMMHVDALVKDNQTERARALVTEHAIHLGEAQSIRLNAIIDAHRGKDPRKQFELLYRRTGDLVDLKNLVSYLKNVNDRAALRPLICDLFDRERTVENALDVVRCFGVPSFFDYEAIIGFLEANPDIFKLSNDLKGVKAWALFQAGRLQDSRNINDILLGQRKNQDDLHLDINIAISSGDWERVPAILDREWPRRESHDPEMLMTLAQLGGQYGQTTAPAIQLARLAAERAPDDPRILATAYWLHFRLGREDKADRNWLVRAVECSSPDEGPLWRVSPRDLAEWIPKRRDHLRDVERKWLSSGIPMSVAADRFNESLARLLLQVPCYNENKLDGRSRAILPIIAGGRNPIELQDEWTIGLDVTSIMVLTHLDLLETAIDAFHHIKLAPDVMEFLFQERDEVRFHQPSRIRAAKQVRELQSRGQLRVADNLAAPPQAITEEVGLELATVLQTARHDNGKVICVLPIHRAGSLMEKRADTSDYDDLVLSTMDLCTLLHAEGKIDTADHQHAKLFLNSRGQTGRTNLPPSMLDGPIYVDGLALSYLQSAHVLQPMAAVGLDIRIHPDVLDQMSALIKEGDVGDNLVSKIEGIRDVLRNVVASGKASFLPRTASQDEQTRNHEFRFQATASLLVGSASFDALCIDDRCINSHPVLTEPTGRSVPIVCVSDVLRFLVSRGYMGVPDHWAVRHELRQSGFVIIPLESDELVHWLTAARVSDGRLTESAELRIFRQTMARIDSLDLANPNEMFALSEDVSSTCKQTIVKLWEDATITIERTTALSNWVWRNLMATATWGHEHIEQGGHTDWIRTLISMRLAHLLLPAAIQPHDRRAHYTDWIERSVLEPLRPANADIIEKALTSAREAISALENDQEAFGNRFLEQLPESARRVVIAHDAEFAKRCGFETTRVFRIGFRCQIGRQQAVCGREGSLLYA